MWRWWRHACWNHGRFTLPRTAAPTPPHPRPTAEDEFVQLAHVVHNKAPTFPGNFSRALEEFDVRDGVGNCASRG